MNIIIIGTGYVGLVTGVCLAEIGHNILFIDKAQTRISHLIHGYIPIYEPKLEQLFLKNRHKMSFSDDLEQNITFSNIIFVCVNTPQNANGDCDLSYIQFCLEEIKLYANDNKNIVIKSTVPVGTVDKFQSIFADHYFKFFLISNPEFLREGSAIDDFMQPDRIIVGCEDDYSKLIMSQIYEYFISKNVKYIVTNIATAEMIKHASNSFLAVKLSFMNELSWFAEAVGADINDLEDGIGSDPRIGNQYLKIGPGFGGSCLPKDTRAFVNNANTYNTSLNIIKQAVDVNTIHLNKIFNKILNLLYSLNVNIQNDIKLSVLGLTFKKNTDDYRDSAALYLINKLIEYEFYNISAYDPQAKISLQYLTVYDDPYQACLNVDIIIIATEWEEFTYLNWNKIYKQMKHPIIYDLRNILEIEQIQKIGFRYYCLGKKI